MNELITTIDQFLNRLVGSGNYSITDRLEENKIYVSLRWSDREDSEEIAFRLVDGVNEKVNNSNLKVGNFSENYFLLTISN